MKRPLLDPRTRQLLLSYLAVIMVLSVLFSAIIFAITSSQLDRPLPPHRQPTAQNAEGETLFQERISERNEQTRASLLVSLGMLNIGMLAGGTVLSYYLARRTLRPIEATMRTQKRFINDASHELRTPLTGLQASTEVALRKKSATKETYERALQRNLEEIKRLQVLSGQLLSMNQEGSTAAPTTQDIHVTIENARAQVVEIAANKHIAIENAVTSTDVHTEHEIVQHIVQNYLENAVKYAPEKSSVTISSQRTKSDLTIYVQDEGEGVAEADRPHVFERFYRADSARTRSNTSGHGLGLSIVAELAERYGYRVGVDAVPSGGAIFFVTVSFSS